MVVGRCKETFSFLNETEVYSLFDQLNNLVRQQDFEYELWVWFVLRCK